MFGPRRREVPPVSSQTSLGEFGSGADAELSPERIRDELEAADGNVAQAARELGLTRTTFYRRASKFGIDVGGIEAKLINALPEDVGLTPLGCSECGAREIGGHPCPECGHDPRLGGAD